MLFLLQRGKAYDIKIKKNVDIQFNAHDAFLE